MRAELSNLGAQDPEDDRWLKNRGPLRPFGFLAMIKAWIEESTCNRTNGDSR